jgi:hypothetical protein
MVMEIGKMSLVRRHNMERYWGGEMHAAYINCVFSIKMGNEYKSREFAVICAHYARLLYPQLH